MPPRYQPVQDKTRWGKRNIIRPLLSSVSLLFFLATTFTGGWAAVLTHGPVVGGVTPNRARVFVRTDSPGLASIQIGTDSALSTPWITDSITTSSQSDFTAIIPLPNLTPGTRYFMNVLVNGIPQLKPPYPTFKTFPPVGRATQFKFIILTDFMPQRNVKETVSTYANASLEDSAFAFIGGDFDHRNPVSRESKRKMFKDLYDANSIGLHGFVSEILRKVPIVHHWDDHDTGGNNIDKNYQDQNVSYHIFREYVPTYPLY